MIIDNGERVRLQITGVFDGEAGYSRGYVAFVPNQAGKAPQDARVGLLDGQAVRLSITLTAGVCTAAVEPLA